MVRRRSSSGMSLWCFPNAQLHTALATISDCLLSQNTAPTDDHLNGHNFRDNLPSEQVLVPTTHSNPRIPRTYTRHRDCPIVRSGTARKELATRQPQDHNDGSDNGEHEGRDGQRSRVVWTITIMAKQRHLCTVPWRGLPQAAIQ